MYKEKIILVLIILGLTTCQKNQYQPYSFSIFQDSLSINLKEKSNEFKKFLANKKETRKMRILSIKADVGWIAFGYSGERVFSPTKIKTNQVELNKILSKIVRLRNLKKLDISLINLEKLPKATGQLCNLEELDLSFNPLNLYVEIDKLKKLRHLKVLRLYGVEINQLLLKSLQSVHKNLEIRYTTDNFKEDMQKKYNLNK